MNEPYLIVAYFVLWFFVFGYLLVLGLKFKALDRKLSQMENTLSRPDKP